MYSQGIDGLVHIADESAAVHPSLYLAAMDVYGKAQDYEKIEKTGEKVLEKVNRQLKIRAEICLKAAYASFRLGHEEKMSVSAQSQQRKIFCVCLGQRKWQRNMECVEKKCLKTESGEIVKMI